MNIEDLQKYLSKELENFLKRELPAHSFQEVYQYALLPPGKLFRPMLTHSIYNDLNSSHSLEVNEDVTLGALASEIHHTYTLIHDDLPCMDNDDFRRGKPSTHKKFGQWQAVLAGDGLLNLSFRAISKIKHKNNIVILKLFSKLLGAQGLIQGQVLDLSDEMTLSPSNLLLTHELKTARLIQCALLTGALLCDDKNLNLKKLKNLFRMGKSLGIFFQLVDDLLELTEDVGEHEKKVNPWPKWTEVMSTELVNNGEYVINTLKEYKLKKTEKVILSYVKKVIDTTEQNSNAIYENLKDLSQSHKNYQAELVPVMTFLNRLSDL